jgi:DNA-binding MarR family transcriptional regulator
MGNDLTPHEHQILVALRNHEATEPDGAAVYGSVLKQLDFMRTPIRSDEVIDSLRKLDRRGFVEHVGDTRDGRQQPLYRLSSAGRVRLEE